MVTIFNSGGIEIDADHERDASGKLIPNRFIALVLKDHAKIREYPTGQLILRKLKLNLCMFEKRLMISPNLAVELVRGRRVAIRGPAGMARSDMVKVADAAKAEQEAKADATRSRGNAGPFGDTGNAIVVTYDPLTPNGYGDANPGWLVLAHEFIHTLHYFEGGKTVGEAEHAGATVEKEELRTVGLGEFQHEAICENQLRREAKLVPRTKY